MTRNPIKRRLAAAMKEYFGTDRKRIRHALAVLHYAEKIMRKEPCDRDVVTAACLLHDIGIHEAERKYGSTAGRYQEKEGPPIAAGIMKKLRLPAGLVDEVCEIIAHHHTPGVVQTANFQVLYEADWIVNLGDDFAETSLKQKRNLIDKNFKTVSGKSIAERLYLKQGS